MATHGPITLVIAVLLGIAPGIARANGGGHAKEEVEEEVGSVAPAAAVETALGEREEGGLRAVGRATLGAEVELEVRLTRRQAPPDPILGEFAPVADAVVTVAVESAGAIVAGPLAAHGEGEAGVYGAHVPRLVGGAYTIVFEVSLEGNPPFTARFPLAVASPPLATAAAHAGEHAPTGHHAMAHPFLTHMGIPDGPGEVSVRLSGIRRVSGEVGGEDVAFHVEAGIAKGLGLHLRNDAITGAGKANDEDHGTELMLMYAPWRNDEGTMGMSIFGEVSAPTRGKSFPATAPLLATLPVNFGAGIGARYMWQTYVLVDAIVHAAPMELYDGVMVEYEGSLQVRPIGRIYLIVETYGEVSAEGVENVVAPAVKVGLGKGGPIVGAALAFATTPDRPFDRQALFQLDWSFE